MSAARSSVVILNFHPERLPRTVVDQIEEETGRRVDERMVRFSINTVKYTYPQTLTCVDGMGVADLPSNVVFHLPGLPTGAVYLVAEFYARTGMFPCVLELKRSESDRKTWEFGCIRDLNVEVDQTRKNPQRRAGTRQP